MGTGMELGAAFDIGFSLDDISKAMGDQLDLFRKRDPRPIRRKFTAASEVTVAGSTLLTICRVTPAGGPPAGTMWDLRAIWVGVNTLATNTNAGVVFIGNASQAQTHAGGSGDTFKVEDAAISFSGVPYSNNFSGKTYTIDHGDDLYVGVFNLSASDVVVVNARVDEYRDVDIMAGRM